MRTQAELLEEHRQGLDEKFHQDYPLGKFCVQKRLDDGWDAPYSYGNNSVALHWCPKRSTSHTRKKGISIYLYVKSHPAVLSGRFPQLKHENYQNSSFGNTYNYKDLDKFLSAAKKKDIPEELIEAFLTRYNKRSEEGFKI